MPLSDWPSSKALARTLTQSRCGLSRKGQVTRKSKETQLSAKVELDGRGRIHVSTGLPFVDHMLEQVARYGGFDLTFRGAGDLQGAGPCTARSDECHRRVRRPLLQRHAGLIAIVDYGVGNIRSVQRALAHVGAEVRLTAEAGELEAADGVVLPGVGAFAPALA